MSDNKIKIVNTPLYTIDVINKLAIIKFKSEAPIEDLYELENSHTYFTKDLDKISNIDISTRLFIFSKDIFSEEKFSNFFDELKINPDKKMKFLLGETNVQTHNLAKFVNIKHRFINDILDSNKLNVIALEGSSIGLWLSTILSGDFAILSKNSQFTLRFLEDDIFPLGGLMYYLDKYANKSTLDDVMLLGEPISAENLSDWGLVNKVYPTEGFEDKAVEIALEISKKSEFFIRAYKTSKSQFKGRIVEWLEKERSFYAK